MQIDNPKTKIDRVLAAFMSGSNYNRFEAGRQLHDHCLHSTVSTLQKKYGLTISREFETVPGYQGHPTPVCRYWIALEERKRFERQRANIRKQKIQTTSVETKGMGFQMYKADDTASVNKSQTELNNGA